MKQHRLRLCLAALGHIYRVLHTLVLGSGVTRKLLQKKNKLVSVSQELRWFSRGFQEDQ